MNVTHTNMIAKVKAVAINFGFFVALAAGSAALQFTDTVDWNNFGIFGVAAGAAVASGLAWVVGYLKRTHPSDLLAAQIEDK